MVEKFDSPTGWIDPAAAIDKHCRFDPNRGENVDSKGRPIDREEGMFPGDPAIRFAAELSARAKDSSKT